MGYHRKYFISKTNIVIIARAQEWKKGKEHCFLLQLNLWHTFLLRNEERMYREQGV
jgi:hypothetical protein